MRWLGVVCVGSLLVAVVAQVPALDDEIPVAQPKVTTATTDPEESPSSDSIVQNENESEESVTSEPNEIESSTAGNDDNIEENSAASNSEATSEEVQLPAPESSENSHEEEEHTSDEQENQPSEEMTNSEENNKESEEQTGSQEVSKSLESVAASNEIVEEPVETEGGLVQGYYLHGDEASGIRSFYDIPYGSYSLFGVPTKHASWDDVHLDTEHHIRCPQMDDTGEVVVGDQDCLTLSVFTPIDVENAAVLFHIHDGDFKSGSADPLIYGPDYLVPKGIILVLPNYRLSALGFLCLRNSISYGNAGLKDLTLALNWTKNNIAAFGGDPANIYVSGLGSAGALAGYLALSPKSRDYVSGVIAESGSVMAHWAVDRNPTTTANKLAENLSQEIGEDLDLELLIKAAKNITFRPCIENGDDAFLDKSPWTILHEETVNKTFMLGSANHAGLLEAMRMTTESIAAFNEDLSTFLPDDLKFDNEEEGKEIGASLKKQYFNEETVSQEHLQNISLYYTDAYYLGPALRTARLLVAAGAKVYFYEFSFVGQMNRELESSGMEVEGATRGDIVGYVFKQDGDEAQVDVDDEKMIERLTTLWVALTQTGTPAEEDWATFESVAEAEEQWLSIGSELATQTGVHTDRLSLWTHIYNEYFVERSSTTSFTANIFILVTAIIMLFGVD